MTKQNQDSPVNRGSVAVPRTPRPSIRPTGIQSEASRQPGENREASALGRSVVHAGDGMILHAPTPGDVVRVQSASYATFEYYRI